MIFFIDCCQYFASTYSTLAQDNDNSKSTINLYVSLGLLAAAIIVLAITITIVRKKYFTTDDYAPSANPFSLGDLKRMHQQGKLTDEEYQKAKEKIIAMYHSEPDQKKAENLVEKPDEDTDNPQHNDKPVP